MTTVLTRIYAPADLLTMPNSSGVELVNSNLLEKPGSVLSTFVETKILTRLENFCDARKTAVVLSSANSIQCFPIDSNKVRKPGAAVFKRERFTREHLMKGFVSIAPDLAVEVVSTHDKLADVVEKVEEYLSVGIPLVWVIDPENEIVYIRRGDGSVTKLHKNDELSGENILPGFGCKVAELFPDANGV